MPVSWPVGVPKVVLRDGVSFTPESGRLEFEPELGAAIARRQTTMAIARYNLAFAPWTAAQLVLFETWFQDVALAGSEEFLLDDPITGDSAVWRFADTYSVQKDPVKTYVRVSMFVLKVRLA